MGRAYETPAHSRGPRPASGIWQIEAYVGGASTLENVNRVFKLSSNETPLGPSPAAIEAFMEAGKELHFYPDGSAAELKEAIAKTYGVTSSHLLVGAGSDELLSLLAQAYLGPGDEALCTEHSFLVYRIAALANNAVPVYAPERDHRADVDSILERVGPRTRIVFLANPNNPTGTYLSASEVERLHAGLPEDVLLVLDGAYAEYVEADDYEAGAALVAKSANVVMTRTFSKIYGLAALRLGWALAPPGIVEAIERIRGPFNVSTPGQLAGIAALGDRAHVRRARAHNTAWLPRLSKEISDLGIGVVPSVGNFLMLDFAAFGPGAATAADAVLKQGGVIVRGLANYGFDNALRVSIGSEEANGVLMTRLQAFVEGQSTR